MSENLTKILVWTTKMHACYICHEDRTEKVIFEINRERIQLFCPACFMKELEQYNEPFSFENQIELAWNEKIPKPTKISKDKLMLLALTEAV